MLERFEMPIPVAFQVSEELAMRFRDGRVRSWEDLTDAEQAVIYAEFMAASIAGVGPAAAAVGKNLVGFWVGPVLYRFDQGLTVAVSEPGFMVCDGRPGFRVALVEGVGVNGPNVFFCDAVAIAGLETVKTPFVAWASLPDVEPVVVA